MDHVAILKKEWVLLPKILEGTKTVESRWYKTRRVPWNKIKAGETVYFKDSGEPVTARAKVSKVMQYTINNNEDALELMQKHALADLGINTIPESVCQYIRDKKYAIFIWFTSIEKVKPFNIDKRGFGMQSAWLTLEDIVEIKVPNSQGS